MPQRERQLKAESLQQQEDTMILLDKNCLHSFVRDLDIAECLKIQLLLQYSNVIDVIKHLVLYRICDDKWLVSILPRLHNKKTQGSNLFNGRDDRRTYNHFNQCISLALGVHGVLITQGLFLPMRKIRYSSSERRIQYVTDYNSSLTALFLHYLKVLPTNNIVKAIKISLASRFSLEANQELPSPVEEMFPVFPVSFETSKQFKSLLQGDRKRKLSFFWSILQSKSCCAKVDQGMIDEAYVKHKSSLCTDTPLLISEELKSYLYTQGVEFGKLVKGHYDPFLAPAAAQSSCIENSKSKGGQKSYLYEHIRDFNNEVPEYSISDHCPKLDSERFEPVVIGLFGPPGVGKTRMLIKFLRNLKKIFKFGDDVSKLAYSRSCNTDHWDGYNNQPVTILDDFGQDPNGTDLGEFMNLVSTNEYVLPMADLQEKGKRFNSPVIILSSNLVFGQALKDSTSSGHRITQPKAFWRRFDFALRFRSKSETKISHDNPDYSPIVYSFTNYFHSFESNSPTTNDRGNKLWDLPSAVDGACSFRGVALNGEARLSYGSSCDHPLRYDYNQFVNLVSQRLIEKETIHSEYLSPIWTQTLMDEQLSFTEYNGYHHHINTGKRTVMSLNFEREVPTCLPIVRAVALAEPLKVRMITLGESKTRVLKPFQEAMEKSLENMTAFRIRYCKDTMKEYPIIVKELLNAGSSDDIWLSGDYTAATDNLSMDVTQSLIEGILSQIDHEPTKEWARWETGPHRILYENSCEGIQTSGQLMGSLLSFPLLCLANLATAKLAGVSEDRVLINGDDILMRANKSEIQKWKEVAPKLGLSLSLGKNFEDKNFGSINSQMFYDGEYLKAGKISLLVRGGKVIGSTYADLQRTYGYETEITKLYVGLNQLQLRNTYQSLDVPFDYGGLGSKFKDGRKITKYDRLCYLYKFFQQGVVSQINLKKITPLNSYTISVPKTSNNTSATDRFVSRMIGAQPRKLDVADPGVITRKQIHKFEKDFSREDYPNMWKFVDRGNLQDTPSLGGDREFRIVTEEKLKEFLKYDTNTGQSIDYNTEDYVTDTNIVESSSKSLIGLELAHHACDFMTSFKKLIARDDYEGIKNYFKTSIFHQKVIIASDFSEPTVKSRAK